MTITARSNPCLTKRSNNTRQLCRPITQLVVPGASPSSIFFLPQVFLTTLDFLDSVLVSIGACKEARHNHVVAALEPTVATLLNKLGDGQARLRDGAMNGLVAVARCRTAGPTFVR